MKASNVKAILKINKEWRKALVEFIAQKLGTEEKTLNPRAGWLEYFYLLLDKNCCNCNAEEVFLYLQGKMSSCVTNDDFNQDETLKTALGLVQIISQSYRKTGGFDIPAETFEKLSGQFEKGNEPAILLVGSDNPVFTVYYPCDTAEPVELLYWVGDEIFIIRLVDEVGDCEELKEIYLLENIKNCLAAIADWLEEDK